MIIIRDPIVFLFLNRLIMINVYEIKQKLKNTLN